MRRAFSCAVAVGIAVLGLVGSAGASLATFGSSHIVPLNCPFGDQRSTYDASVQPGIIVPDTSGFPYFPTDYTAFGFNKQTQEPMVIGNFNVIATPDHLVSAWMNSTNCFRKF